MPQESQMEAKAKGYSDDRVSLALEIKETLETRGCWVPEKWSGPDLITAVAQAIDKRRQSMKVLIDDIEFKLVDTGSMDAIVNVYDFQTGQRSQWTVEAETANQYRNQDRLFTENNFVELCVDYIKDDAEECFNAG